MHIDVFKRIAKQVSDLEKTGVKFDVVIQGDTSWMKGAAQAQFEPWYYEITTLAQLSQLQQILGKPVAVNNANVYGNASKVVLKDIKINSCVTNLADTITDERSFMLTRNKHNTVKFYSHNITKLTNLKPMLISDVPAEQLEDGVTYRFIGTPTLCELCVPHDSAQYNYLDKGFIYAKISSGLKEKDKFIITNELTPDTYLVMLACFLNPANVKQLENECFINYNKAKLFRIKFEKDMNPGIKPAYDRVKEIVLADYEKSVNSNMLVKVARGDLPVATYNRIKITKNTAVYEGISIEAPSLLEFLQDKLVFDDRTDIYTIIGSFITAKIAELEAEKFPEQAEVLNDKGEVQEPKVQSIEKDFVINGIKIKLKRTSNNTRRTVNGFTINMDELDPVCFRASCFETQEIFDKFVRSVHTMSLKWHDAIGSGLPVKIHDGLTALEYKSPEAPMSCPRIRFLKDEKDVYLITGEGEEDKVKIKLNYTIKKIESLNRKTNNRYSVGQGYSPRNAAWARRELINILKEACTFERRGGKILDADGKEVLGADGKPTYNIITTRLLTDEKAAFIGKMAQTYYDKAVQRSRLFLDNAVKQTNAKSIEFNGEECWYVEGNLHKYAVSKKTNTVFNFDRGNYICIVEPGHRVEVGFDATATRLLALKNDSVVVSKVGTLRHG